MEENQTQPPQPPVENHEQVKSEQKSFNLKNKWPFLVIAVLLVLVGIFGGYFVMSQTKQSQTPAASPTPTTPQDQTGNPNLSPGQPKVTENPKTVDWKTYKDIQEGIEFKYPSTWTAKDINRETLSVFLEDRPFEFCDACEFMTSIQVTYNWYKNTETDELFYSEKTLDEGQKRILELGDPESVKIEKLKIGGKDAVKISGINGPGPLQGREFIYTLVQMDNRLLVINLSNIKHSNVYNNMLSTFRFD